MCLNKIIPMVSPSSKPCLITGAKWVENNGIVATMKNGSVMHLTNIFPTEDSLEAANGS